MDYSEELHAELTGAIHDVVVRHELANLLSRDQTNQVIQALAIMIPTILRVLEILKSKKVG